MKRLQETLSVFVRPNILDVGCGVGNFIHLLLAAGLTEATYVGIDTSAAAIQAATKQFEAQKNVSFQVGDVTAAPFEDHSFDVVCLSNTLHHLKEPKKVFAAMKRLLKPGGMLLVNEMISDGLTEAQKSHRKLHHFAAEIDREMGAFHAPTYARDEYLRKLGRLAEKTPDTVWDLTFESGPAPTSEQVEQLATTVDRLLARVPDGPFKERMKAKGERIKRHMRKHSYDGATQVAAAIVFKDIPQNV